MSGSRLEMAYKLLDLSGFGDERRMPNHPSEQVELIELVISKERDLLARLYAEHFSEEALDRQLAVFDGKVGASIIEARRRVSEAYQKDVHAVHSELENDEPGRSLLRVLTSGKQRR